MKVFVRPIPATLSQAMHRVARALARYAPEGVEVVADAADADLQVLHVIGLDSMEGLAADRYVVIQYCHATASGADWTRVWDGAEVVWSYYDLAHPRAWRSPLGVDEVFGQTLKQTRGALGVMTSGYVSGPGAEAIEEVAIAAAQSGLTTCHLGPKPVGMTTFPRGWTNINGVNDQTLVNHYQAAKWVSGLRHVEGFELPVIEGLACGARPVVFEREDMRHWFSDWAVFVKECSGQPLIDELVEVFRYDYPVSEAERQEVIARFDWSVIASEFWARALSGVTA